MHPNRDNLMTSEIELRQQLSVLECEWLAGCLHARSGVTDVRWGDKAGRLFIQYNAYVFGSAEIVDFLNTHGLQVAAIRAGYA